MGQRCTGEYMKNQNVEEIDEILIEPCEFWMGSEEDDDDAFDNEKPRRKVRLTRGYWLMKTPVTQALWEAVMGENPSRFQGADRPVELVNWYDAIRFCNALSELKGLPLAYEIGEGDRPEVSWDRDSTGYRLPTEAEWECAAKAGTELKYAGSDCLGEVGWYYDNCNRETHPVAQKKPNAWGLYDMSGNVWEWCWDLYGDYEGSNRVYRGGSWFNLARGARSALRGGNRPVFRYDNLGLRPARTVEPKESDFDADPDGSDKGSDRVYRGGCWSGVARYARSAFRGRVWPAVRSSVLGLRPARTEK
jgi:formylglycine-generating enzyme required for sulfatase activity